MAPDNIERKPTTILAIDVVGNSRPNLNARRGRSDLHPPSLAELEKIVRAAFAALPPEFRKLAEGVALLVADFPDGETLAAMEIADPFELLGLYHGVSLDQKSLADVPHDLCRVFNSRRPSPAHWRDAGEPRYGLARRL